MSDLRALLALLPDADEPVYFSPDVATKLEAACDRFEAEWQRLFGAITPPVAPCDDDEPETPPPGHAPAPRESGD